MEYSVSVWGAERVARAKDPGNWPQNRVKSLTGSEIWRIGPNSEKSRSRGQEHLCSMCQTINFNHLFSVLLEDNRDEVILGYLDEIAKNVDCDFCCVLVDTICDFTGVRPVMTMFQGQRVKCDLRNTMGGHRTHEDDVLFQRYIWLCCIPELPPARKTPSNLKEQSPVNVRPLNTPLPWCMKQTLGGQYMKLHRIDDNPHWPGSGAYVSQYVKFNLLNSWLDEFPATHSLARGNSAKLPPAFRLIDIEQQSLVYAPPKAEYAILSYVWGRLKRNFLRALKGNLSALERKGGVSPDNPSLPRTIRDAMDLAKGLEQRYLWVDSLCIVQDDPISNSSQIAAMDAIYSLASFTIVAASSEDADSGLPGSPRSPRKLCQSRAKVMGISIVNRFPDLNDTMDASLWNTRAWTFQERVLSERCLVFTDKQVYYLARGRARMCEDSVEDITIDPAQPDSHQIDNNQPNWLQYATATANYSSRKLSFQSDIVNGFTGIMKVFEHRFGGEYVFGLPGVFLDWALLWHSRTSLKRFNNLGPKSLCFPNYCWSGWIGEVAYEFPRQLYSRVLWTNHSAKALEELFTSNMYQKLMRATQGGEIDIQQEYGILANNHQVEDGEQEYTLRYDCPRTGYLQFWTQIAFFNTTALETPNPYAVTALMGCDLDIHDGRFKSILGAQNTVIGAVHLDCSISSLSSSDETAFILLSRTTAASLRRERLQSQYTEDNSKGSGDNTIWDQEQFDADKEDMSDEFGLYNVMAVSASKGLSRRLGVGLIDRKAFYEGHSQRKLITLS